MQCTCKTDGVFDDSCEVHNDHKTDHRSEVLGGYCVFDSFKFLTAFNDATCVQVSDKFQNLVFWVKTDSAVIDGCLLLVPETNTDARKAWDCFKANSEMAATLSPVFMQLKKHCVTKRQLKRVLESFYGDLK